MKENSLGNSGFTLLELLLALAISSIIIVSLYSVLNFTVKTCKLGDEEDEVLLNGRYAIEYIKREIKSAEKIIDINMIPDLKKEYENNIGFIIMRYINDGNYKYNYSTYYLKNDKIYRIAANMNTENYPNSNAFEGHNQIAEYVTSLEETRINFEAKLIDLTFTLKGEYTKETRFNTKLYIRCPIVY
jgi:prepilin-type N-terminal cleavage/methylation domain-containing protein